MEHAVYRNPVSGASRDKIEGGFDLMKKLFSLLLAAVMVLGMLSALAEDIGDSLVVYTPQTEKDCEVLVEGFNELYPDCYVEIITGSAGELTARIAAEKDNPAGDVMVGGLNQTDGDKYADIFAPYVSANDSELLPAYQNNNGMYSYNFMVPVCFVVNTTILNELGITVKSYQDLLQPELNGRIIVADPNSSSAGWNNYSNILSCFGYDSPETWDYLEKLMNNKLIVVTSSSTVFKSVGNGEYAVGLTAEDQAATLLRDGNTEVAIFYPEEGCSAFAFAGAVIKGCKHEAAAKAFLDYTLDAHWQGVRAQAQGTLRMTNPNAKYESEYLKPYDEIKWVDRDISWLTANKDLCLEKWNELYTKAN